MRKIAFVVSREDDIQKLMLYRTIDGVYLFCYDTWQDAPSTKDYLFDTVSDAEEFAEENYNVDDWILIGDAMDGCQHDIIIPTKIKLREYNDPGPKIFLSLVNGTWRDSFLGREEYKIGGTTVNERLWISGLLDIFDEARKQDKQKAAKILSGLQFAKNSIDSILNKAF